MGLVRVDEAPGVPRLLGECHVGNLQSRGIDDEGISELHVHRFGLRQPRPPDLGEDLRLERIVAGDENESGIAADVGRCLRDSDVRGSLENAIGVSGDVSSGRRTGAWQPRRLSGSFQAK